MSGVLTAVIIETGFVCSSLSRLTTVFERFHWDSKPSEIETTFSPFGDRAMAL